VAGRIDNPQRLAAPQPNDRVPTGRDLFTADDGVGIDRRTIERGCNGKRLRRRFLAGGA